MCSVIKIGEDILVKVHLPQPNGVSKIPTVGEKFICISVIGKTVPTSDVRYIEEFPYDPKIHGVAKVTKNALVCLLNRKQEVFIESPGPYLLTGYGDSKITVDFKKTSRKRKATVSDQALGVAPVKPTKKKLRAVQTPPVLVQTPPVLVQTPSVLHAVYGSLEHWKRLKKFFGQMIAGLQRKKENVARFTSVRTNHEADLSSLLPSDVDNRQRIQRQIDHYGAQEDIMNNAIKTYEAKMKVKKDEMDEIAPHRASYIFSYLISGFPSFISKSIGELQCVFLISRSAIYT